MTAQRLREVDRVEILTLIDNSVDLLMDDTPHTRRFAVPSDGFVRESLVAEHGFAALVKVHSGDTSEVLLFDGGLSKHGLMHNMDVLELRPDDLHAIVLSHGHADHTNGLMGLVERMGKRRVPLVLHPDAWFDRRLAFPDGRELRLPPPDRRVLGQEGIEFVEERGPSYMVGGSVLVTGEIERTTPFERGVPIHQVRIAGTWRQDSLIHDDQAIVINLRDRGLVILTGCSHAGAINTIQYARKLTGVQKVYAVIGGLHLSGRLFEKIIDPTVSALKELAPAIVVPAHCTGWKATLAIARELPEAFVANSVGTRVVLTCEAGSQAARTGLSA
jgi:7,8-dihydropterin-6-yl-methyl-4-(beta-D-ribofuranosyl)aminobenzene 5'-phosphate synthase